MLSIIVILAIMFAINLAMIFAVIRLAKRTGDNLQKFFLDKAGYLFDVKEKEENIVEVNQTAAAETEESKIVMVANDVDNTKYKSATFGDEYKNLKSEMDFDRDAVIINVISDDELDDKEHEFDAAIMEIDKSFDFETIYELGTVSGKDQIKVLREVFNKKQNEFLDKYLEGLEGKDFAAIDFFNNVKENAKLVDQNYYVKTGWEDEYYDDLGDNVVTVHDDNIVEGIKIVHKNKMYDYSI